MEELTPITRKETYLAKAAGQDVTTPEPVTREEVFLNAIANGGGSGGGVLVVHDVEDTLDKTWQEIYDADAVVICETSVNLKRYYTVTSVAAQKNFMSPDTKYVVLADDPEDPSEDALLQFTTSSADGYPVYVPVEEP